MKSLRKESLSYIADPPMPSIVGKKRKKISIPSLSHPIAGAS
jgi:hypothetical protein